MGCVALSEVGVEQVLLLLHVEQGKCSTDVPDANSSLEALGVFVFSSQKVSVCFVTPWLRRDHVNEFSSSLELILATIHECGEFIGVECSSTSFEASIIFWITCYRKDNLGSIGDEAPDTRI